MTGENIVSCFVMAPSRSFCRANLAAKAGSIGLNALFNDVAYGTQFVGQAVSVAIYRLRAMLSHDKLQNVAVSTRVSHLGPFRSISLAPLIFGAGLYNSE